MRSIIILILLVSIIFVYAAATESHSNKKITAFPESSIVKKVVVAADCDPCCDNFTEDLNSIYGYLERVAIDVTGDDTAFAIYIKDEYGITLWSKADLNATSGDVTYAITMASTDSNTFGHVPVAGTCSVEVADANTDGATEVTELNIIIYYREEQTGR